MIFLKENLGREDIPYNLNVQGLLNSGLMYQSVIDGNGDQRYSFTTVAKMVDEFAVSYEENNDQTDIGSILSKNRKQETKVTGIENNIEIATYDEVKEMMDDVFGKVDL